MKYETLAALIFLAVAFGGLAYIFVSMTDDINETVTAGSGVQTDILDGESAPAAGPIVEADAPIVLGSPSITTNAARDEVIVDFFECIPGSGSLDFESGSVSFEMKGLEGNDCVVEYSVEGDDVTCRVPSGIGVKRFSIEDEVPRLGAIESYCVAS